MCARSGKWKTENGKQQPFVCMNNKKWRLFHTIAAFWCIKERNKNQENADMLLLVHKH